MVFENIQILSKPQPNLNTTFGFHKKITLKTPPPTPPQKLNVSIISAVTDPIFIFYLFIYLFRTNTSGKELSMSNLWLDIIKAKTISQA